MKTNEAQQAFRINTDCISAMDEDKMRYSNIEVFGKVVVE